METKLIIVGGTKGGPGKSTVAQQVAAGLQLKRGKKVHITDIDIQQTTTSWCEERRNNKNLDLIAFSYIENDIVKHLQSLNGRYEYIVVDAGGFDSEIQREAMLIADIVLLPLRPKRRDLKSLRKIIKPGSSNSCRLESVPVTAVSGVSYPFVQRYYRVFRH